MRSVDNQIVYALSLVCAALREVNSGMEPVTANEARLYLDSLDNAVADIQKLLPLDNQGARLYKLEQDVHALESREDGHISRADGVRGQLFSLEHKIDDRVEHLTKRIDDLEARFNAVDNSLNRGLGEAMSRLDEIEDRLNRESLLRYDHRLRDIELRHALEDEAQQERREREG